jgi:N-acylneuraminate cytidylyltransferase
MKYYEVNYTYINKHNGQGKALISIINYSPNDYIRELNGRDEDYTFMLINNEMNLCIIPARSKSKRIKNKNFKRFHGKQIIEYSIETAINSKLFDKIIIAIDDLTNLDEIAGNKEDTLSCERTGYKNCEYYERNPQNSKNTSTIFDIFKEIIQKENTLFEYCCILYPCAPFTTVQHLEKGFEVLKNDAYNVVYPIVKFYQSINKDLYIDNDLRKWYVSPEYLDHDSSEIFNKRYYHAGQWFWCNVKKILKTDKIVQQKGGYIVLRDYEVHDINTMEDWKIAKEKYKLLKLGGYLK